jgi:hypothetical protein
LGTLGKGTLCTSPWGRVPTVTAVDVPQLGVTHDKRLKIKPTLDNKLVNIITSLVLSLSCFVSLLVDGI